MPASSSEPAPASGGDRAYGVWHCYRHPGRESGVRCQRCEQPICPDCMISASVGFQCPECVAQAPPVHTMRSLAPSPVVTVALIAVSVAVFVPSLGGGAPLDGGGGDLVTHLALHGPEVADGQWWRLITSGFLHFGLIHLGFNMVLLYQLGSMLEPELGRVRFAALYTTALLAGSFGALLLQPEARTAGASGAVFGLMGAAFIGMRRRGIDPMQSGIGGLLVINLLLTFAIPGISVGGHLGGLAGGAVAAAVLFATEGGDAARRAAGVVGCAALAAAAVAGSVLTATTPLWPF
ncbi:MAG: rhomboid family intramembrane serine protease [Actinobacteria bacterium]|nr:rhomboid family intramembrane serine protease [Actinomycetota bacterium]MBW3641520.1 rhomboid family intramembrane serine protease [Actinomycetota bacterium]